MVALCRWHEHLNYWPAESVGIVTVNVLFSPLRRTHGDGPGIRAAAGGTAEAVEVLIASGSDLNACESRAGETVLMCAAGSGKQSSVKVRALLKAGADPHLTDDRGYNALLSAVQNNDLVCAEVLLRAGFDPKHRTRDGETAMTIAREMNSSKNLIKLLREAAGGEEI
jgi:ankyrin repeat protein